MTQQQPSAAEMRACEGLRQQGHLWKDAQGEVIVQAQMIDHNLKTERAAAAKLVTILEQLNKFFTNSEIADSIAVYRATLSPAPTPAPAVPCPNSIAGQR